MPNITGQFTASGQSAIISVSNASNSAFNREFLLLLTGTFSASISVEVRNPKNADEWAPVLASADGTPLALTAAGALPIRLPATGLQFRLNCAWTSGTVKYSFGNEF